MLFFNSYIVPRSVILWLADKLPYHHSGRNSAEWSKIKIEEIEKLLGLTLCRVDRINCLIIIMDCELRNSAEWRKVKIEEIEKLLGLTGCRVDRINCLIMDCYGTKN